jgi:hypothetical protein
MLYAHSNPRSTMLPVELHDFVQLKKLPPTFQRLETLGQAWVASLAQRIQQQHNGVRHDQENEVPAGAYWRHHDASVGHEAVMVLAEGTCQKKNMNTKKITITKKQTISYF